MSGSIERLSRRTNGPRELLGEGEAGPAVRPSDVEEAVRVGLDALEDGLKGAVACLPDCVGVSVGVELGEELW